MKKLLFATLPLFLSACAGLGPKLDKDKTSKVRKVAIIAIEVHQQQPKDALGFSKAGELKSGPMRESPEMQKMVRGIYDDSVQRLQRITGWHTLTYDSLTRAPAYEKKVDKVMSGARMTSMSPDGAELISLKGILDIYAYRKMSLEEKAQMMKSIGVDAVAEILVYQSIEQGWGLGNLTGDGAFSFKARANMMVFEPHSDEPIWRIQNVDGENSANSDSLPKGMPKIEKLSVLGEKATQSAVSKMLDSYKM